MSVDRTVGWLAGRLASQASFVNANKDRTLT